MCVGEDILIKFAPSPAALHRSTEGWGETTKTVRGNVDPKQARTRK